MGTNKTALGGGKEKNGAPAEVNTVVRFSYVRAQDKTSGNLSLRNVSAPFRPYGFQFQHRYRRGDSAPERYLKTGSTH